MSWTTSLRRFATRPLWRWLAPVLLSVGWLPRLALAEGAVKVLDCSIIRQCDAAGHCTDGGGTVSFRLEPLELDAAGRGTYSLSYADTLAEVQAESDTGPFFWNQGRDRHALLVSSETEWLWHALQLQTVPGSAIRFLRCEFQQ